MTSRKMLSRQALASLKTAIWNLRTFVVLACCVGLPLFQAPPVAAQVPGSTAEQPAALVNGEPISTGEVKAVLDARPSPVPLSQAQQRELRMAALDMLIDDVLMRQFLRKHAPAPNPVVVDKEIDDLKKVLAQQKKTLLDFLREGQQTESQLRADIGARVQWKNYLSARFPEDQLKAYYEVNKVFFDKVFVQASHILVKVSSAAPPEERARAREKLALLRNDISAGTITFEEAARKYSECPSKTKGGDIGLFPYKFVVVEPFAKAAFSTAVGQMTDIVTTDFGVHLIKVTNRTKGEPTQFDDMRDTIREVLAQEQELYQRILGDQRKASKIEVFLK